MGRNKHYTPMGRKVSRLAKNQRELAEILGLTQQSVSGKLRGHIAMTIKDLEKIGAHYGVTLVYFLTPVGVGPEASDKILKFIDSGCSDQEMMSEFLNRDPAGFFRALANAWENLQVHKHSPAARDVMDQLAPQLEIGRRIRKEMEAIVGHG